VTEWAFFGLLQALQLQSSKVCDRMGIFWHSSSSGTTTSIFQSLWQNGHFVGILLLQALQLQSSKICDIMGILLVFFFFRRYNFNLPKFVTEWAFCWNSSSSGATTSIFERCSLLNI